jgi:hypothetical protein
MTATAMMMTMTTTTLAAQRKAVTRRQRVHDGIDEIIQSQKLRLVGRRLMRATKRDDWQTYLTY